MPDNTNVLLGKAHICLDGSDLGYTTGGTTVRRDQEIVDVMADQVSGPVRKFRSSERFFITTSLLEATLENLRIAYGYPSSNLQNQCLTLGYQNPCFMLEHELVLKGAGPGCGCRTWVFDRVTSIVSSVEYSMSRDTQVQLAVEWEALIDPDTGVFGQVCDGCEFANNQVCA